MRDWRKLMVERGTRTDVPMKPQVVGYELNRALSDDAIVCSDSGTIATWVARQVEHPPRATLLAERQSGHHGQRLSVRHRLRRSRTPTASVLRSSATAGFPC